MTKQIELTQGKVALVDDADFEWLSQWKWHAQREGRTNVWYALRGMTISNNKQAALAMHREILDVPRGLEVDHKDGNGLNNTRDNLRVCTHAENVRNRALNANSTSGYKGVSRYRNKWRAHIRFDGKKKHLGYFTDAQEAARTYDLAALELHGEFAKLNFPTESKQAAQVQATNGKVTVATP